MDRVARANRIAASNTELAAARRRAALHAAPAARRRLLLDAARLDDLAAQWRQEAAAERAKVVRCWCGRKLSTLPDSDGTGCAEHDGILTAGALA
jgi:hypothetical protein